MVVVAMGAGGVGVTMHRVVLIRLICVSRNLLAPVISWD